jgi:outer membrane protein W
MCLPAYPLNPIEQDTLAPVNLHFTVGINGPNGFTSAGPEATIKYEVLMVHPLVARIAFEYRFGETRSRLYPNGKLHGATLSLVALYYRGTYKLTGYVGAGLLYTFHHFRPSSAAADSLRNNYSISDVSLQPAFGYRIVMGLRFRHTYSLEVGVTEVNPNLAFTEQLAQNRFAVSKERIRMSEVRITIGYVFALKKL